MYDIWYLMFTSCVLSFIYNFRLNFHLVWVSSLEHAWLLDQSLLVSETCLTYTSLMPSLTRTMDMSFYSSYSWLDWVSCYIVAFCLCVCIYCVDWYNVLVCSNLIYFAFILLITNSWSAREVWGVDWNYPCTQELCQDISYCPKCIILCRYHHLLWWLCQHSGCWSKYETFNRCMRRVERKACLHRWRHCRTNRFHCTHLILGGFWDLINSSRA